MYFDITKLTDSYNTAKLAAEFAHSVLVQAENVYKALKIEFDYKVQSGKVNKNSTKVPYSHQLTLYNNAQSAFNLASSFQQFKGQQLIDANLSLMKMA